MKEKQDKIGKTVLICAGIIALTGALIGAAIHFKSSGSGPGHGEKITLGEYEKIPLTLEKEELTDEKLKETAKWYLDYYNQGQETSAKQNGTKAGDKLTLDTLTDEQVKEAFGVDNVDGFYDMVKDYKEESNKKEQRTKAYDQICNYLLDKCTIEKLSGETVKARLDKYLKDTKESCKNDYNMSFSEYCESVGMTEEEYEKSLSDNTERMYKLELIFTAIGDKEDIHYDEKEYEDYISELIENGGYDSKEAVYEQYGEDYLKTAYRVEDIVDWLIEKADITYTEPADDVPTAEAVETETAKPDEK